MAQHYGDIPCVNLSGVIHATVSGSRCACGCEWHYGVSNRSGKFVNIIWRSKDAITCKDCLRAMEKVEVSPSQLGNI